MDVSRREALALAVMLLAGGRMALKAENPVVGGVALRRAAIQSPGFIAGSTGWTINQDGSAEFNNIVIRGGQIVSGTALYYSGTPAAGNLVASVAATFGTDTFGNHYIGGSASYAATTAARTAAGLLQILSGSLAAGWTVIGSVAVNGANMQLSPNGGILQASNANLIMDPGFFTLASNPAAAGTADPWHDMSLLNGWSLGAGGFAQYQLQPDGSVWVRGANVIPGTVVAGTNIWTIPANYRTATNSQRIEIIIENSTGAAARLTPRFDVTTGNQLQVQNLTANDTRVGWNNRYSLT